MPAFTLLETLIVVVLIALLIALLAPSLGAARDTARASVSLGNLRTHAQQLAAYAADSHDLAPFFLDPHVGFSEVRNDHNGYVAIVPFFGAHFTWNIALAAGYYGGDNYLPVFLSPLAQSTRDGSTDYYYSCTFVAHPSYWNELTRLGTHQRTANRLADVQFPDRKVLLWDSSRKYTPDSLRLVGLERVATVDGAAVSRSAYDFRGAAAAGGDGPWEGAMHGTGYPIGMHTLDGVRGRDIR